VETPQRPRLACGTLSYGPIFEQSHKITYRYRLLSRGQKKELLHAEPALALKLDKKNRA
jgi:hypothetical protein